MPIHAEDHDCADRDSDAAVDVGMLFESWASQHLQPRSRIPNNINSSHLAPCRLVLMYDEAC
eukprot:297972-Rhodomonas_salina.1